MSQIHQQFIRIYALRKCDPKIEWYWVPRWIWNAKISLVWTSDLRRARRVARPNIYLPSPWEGQTFLRSSSSRNLISFEYSTAARIKLRLVVIDGVSKEENDDTWPITWRIKLAIISNIERKENEDEISSNKKFFKYKNEALQKWKRKSLKRRKKIKLRKKRVIIRRY